MLTARVGRRGQIVLPKEVRAKIKIEEGDALAFVVDGEQVILKHIKHSLLDMRGCVSVVGVQDFDSIRNHVKAGRVQRRLGEDGN